MDGRIFINYRRSTTAAAAGRLHDRLEQHFARENLFMDVDAIEPGVDFMKVLDQQVQNCRAFIAVIGPNWADTTDSAGHRRLDNPEDYVRIEIEAALKRNIRVIPVLVDDARMPTAEELPPSLRPLSRRQAIEISHARFASDVDFLANTIKRAEGMLSSRKAALLDTVTQSANVPISLSQIIFSFQGRIGRAAYWKGMVVYGAAILFLTIILNIYFFLDQSDSGKPPPFDTSIYDNWRYKFLLVLICIPFYWPYYALVLKRLHDIGQGWQLFGALVLAARVERRGRFVHDDNIGITEKDTCEGQSLLFPARENLIPGRLNVESI